MGKKQNAATGETTSYTVWDQETSTKLEFEDMVTDVPCVFVNNHGPLRRALTDVYRAGEKTCTGEEMMIEDRVIRKEQGMILRAIGKKGHVEIIMFVS